MNSNISHTSFRQKSTQSNYYAEEWKALRGMTGDKTFVQRGLDKGTSLTVWDRSDYLLEKSRQLEVQSIYEDVKFSENILTNLAEKPMKNLNVCVAIN